MWSFPRRGKRNRADFAMQGAPAKPPFWLCGERRSKGACGAFPAGGSGTERTLLCKGPPQSRPFGFVGRGGARERVELSPQGEAEQSGLCDDEFHVKHQRPVHRRALNTPARLPRHPGAPTVDPATSSAHTRAAAEIGEKPVPTRARRKPANTPPKKKGGT